MPSPKILIVEDEQIIGADIRNMLASLGYITVGIASNPEDAVKIIDENPPDLILMDIILGYDRDGIDLTEEINRIYDIPVVFITAHTDKKTLERAMETEPYGYIVKPFEKKDLHSSIQMALYKYRIQRQLKENNSWLNTTLKSIGDAVIATDQDGKIRFMNPVAEELTGWKVAESIGRKISEVFKIINEETRLQAENPVSRVIKEGKVTGLANHTLLVRKDGKEIPIDDSGAPITNEKGEIIGVVLVFHDVSTQQEAIKKIMELSRFPEENPNPVLKVSLKGRIIYANPSSNILLPTISLKGKNLLKKKPRELVSESFTSNQSKTLRVSCDSIIYSLHFVPIKPHDYVYIYGIDITEIEAAYRKLTESETKYRSLIELFPHPLTIIQDGKVVFANSAAFRGFGYDSPDEVIAQDFLKFIHPGERERILKITLKSLKNTEVVPASFRATLIRKDGTEFPAQLFSARTMYLGEPAIQVILWDITEKVRAEKKIKEHEILLSTLIDAMPDIFYFKDINGKYIIVNREFGKLISKERKDIVGKNDFEVFPEDLARQCVSSDNIVKEKKQIVKTEEVTKTAEGKSVFFETIKSPVNNDKGELTGIIGISRDITARKAYEESIRERNFEYQTLLDNSHVGIWRFGFTEPIDISLSPEEIARQIKERGRCIEVNRAFINMYKAQDDSFFLGKTPVELTDNEESMMQRLLYMVKNDFRMEMAEIEELDLEGDRHTFASSYFGFVKEDYLHWIWGIQLDITDRKLSEKMRTALYRIEHSVTTSRNINELFHSIYDTVQSLMPADNFYIALYDREKNIISFPFFKSEKDPTPGPKPLESGLTDYIIRSGNSYLGTVDEIHKMEIAGQFKAQGVPSAVWMGAPLKIEEECIGVIALQDFQNPDTYKKEDLEILEYISNEVARSIERFRALEALQRSEEKFRIFVERFPDAIVVHQKGKIVYANPATYKLIKSNEALILDKSAFEFVHPEYRAIVSKRIQTLLSGESEVPPFEEKLVTPDGRILDVEVSAMKITYNGEPAIQVVVRDISARKMAEKKRRESEESYRNLFNSVGEAIYIQDQDGYFLDVNKSAVEMYGYSREYFIGKTPEFVSAPGKNDLEAIGKAVKEAYNGKPQEFEFWGIRKNGEVFPKEVRLYPGTYFDEKVVIALATDITERKRSEMQLRESEEKYRNIIENSLEGIFIHQNYRIKFCNKQFAGLFGYTLPSELIGKHVRDIVVPEDWEKVQQKVNERIEGILNSAHYTFRGLRKDGTKFECETLGGRIIYKGKPAIQGVVRDISEKVRLEEQLRQAQKMEAIGQLSAGIAHDFNNILTAILGAADMASLSVDSDSPLKDDLKEIKSSVKKAANLTQQLLAFSKKQIRDIKTLDVNATIKNTYKVLRRTVGEDIEFILDLTEGIAPIKADRNQLDQILFNLIINARDAIMEKPRASFPKRITISTEQVYLDRSFRSEFENLIEGEFIQITVSDTGVGIRSEIIDKIFDPFFTTKEVGRGSGMGLASVYGIVKQNSGDIHVYSEPGKGTTFRIYWPVSPEAVLESDKERIYRIKGGNETILVVEDDKHVRGLTVKLLKSLGYKIISAENGETAFKIVSGKRKDIDLLLTDIVMPKMDGMELREKLMKINPGLKTILTSGYSDYYKELTDSELKNTIFLMKPYSRSVLAQKIRKLLDREIKD